MLGVPRAALVRQLRAAAPEPVLDAALGAAIEAGRIVRDGAVLRLPAHQPRLTREDERLWQRLEPLLAVDDLRPPRVRELAEALGIEPEAAIRQLKRFERFGRVAPIAANRYFLPETVARLADLARDLAGRRSRRHFHRRRVQGRSGHRAQPDDRDPRVSRPHWGYQAGRRRTYRAAGRRRRVRLRTGLDAQMPVQEFGSTTHRFRIHLFDDMAVVEDVDPVGEAHRGGDVLLHHDEGLPRLGKSCGR